MRQKLDYERERLSLCSSEDSQSLMNNDVIDSEEKGEPTVLLKTYLKQNKGGGALRPEI